MLNYFESERFPFPAFDEELQEAIRRQNGARRSMMRDGDEQEGNPVPRICGDGVLHFQRETMWANVIEKTMNDSRRAKILAYFNERLGESWRDFDARTADKQIRKGVAVVGAAHIMEGTEIVGLLRSRGIEPKLINLYKMQE